MSTPFGRTTFDNSAYHYAVTFVANGCALKIINNVVSVVVVVNIAVVVVVNAVRQCVLLRDTYVSSSKTPKFRVIPTSVINVTIPLR